MKPVVEISCLFYPTYQRR